MSDTIARPSGMENPAKNRLLLVDGDPKSLRVLDVSLKKAGFEVTTASSGRAALASLEAERPDLIISDTDLDEIDGFELCSRIKAKPEWAKIPFLFVSGRKSIEDKIRGLELGVDDYLTKPIYIKEIGIRVRTALQRAERERMESRREGRTRFAGDLSDVGVVDLVQTIELNRKSGIVHIVNRDDRRGSIFFRDGKVIDAEVGRLSGAHALYRLFSWAEGQFAVEFKHIRRHDVIDMSTAALLMEGMRRLDEATRLLDKLCPPTAVLEVDCRVLAEELAELPDEMNAVLRLCDGARTLLEVVEDSDQPDLETLTLVSKLFGDQIIFARQPADHGGDAEPGVRLATWLSQGGADPAAPSTELPASSEISLLPEREGLDVLPPAPAGGLMRPARVLSAEETLGAALPSCADSAVGGNATPSTPAAGMSEAPPEELFPEADHRASASAPRSPPPDVAPKDARPTQPMGLAARLLSEDSVVQAQAVHEAIADRDGAVTGVASDRNTQSYGGPAATAAALVQEVVTSTHTTVSAPAPADPGRPEKEVDWGAWPTSAAPAPAAPALASLPTAPGRPSPALASSGGAASDSSSELQPADLQEVEVGEKRPSSDRPATSTSGDDGITRLGAEDVLPLDAVLPEPPVPAPGTLAASTSAETTVVVTPHRPASARQLWLLVVGAFALGMLLVLLLERRNHPSDALNAPTSAVTTKVATSASAAEATSVVAVPAPPPPPPVAPSPPPSAEAPPPPEVVAAPTVAPSPTAVELRRKCLDTNADGKGRARAVSAACRPVLEADPTDADIMVILARAEIDRGRLGEARSLAKRALATDATRVEAYVYLGTAEQAAGKSDEARAAYKKYLELAPDGRFAREIRAILNNL